ncbi:FMN-dependent NADH-azoreductase [Yinghuangia seranimata]|uniref:FMN-dependent NADH-azoreductase n=1 Tax=Yinghuangia seranimata TaxID=408067 RepID=UPI00248CA24C|nr:NAD(P)H-dependent oxidoreductase [Yinghuangia seranimata]MDI2131866.1 NAD(P)H-dependent oxidoreductase [Yinghuangia seranimata]
MSQLLHLDSSARTDSFSRRLGAAFADRWRASGGGVTYRDLAADTPPAIREGWTRICDTLLREGITDIARYADAVRTDEEREAWAVVEPLLAELVAADVVLIGAPMYNFGVPAALKAWIDQVTFPKMVLAPRKFVVVSARGGAYGPGMPREPYDHQGRYLLDFFAGHYAVEDGTVISAELVNALVDPGLAERVEQHRASAAQAVRDTEELAAKLAGFAIPRES